jgi:hypothetical protein
VTPHPQHTDPYAVLSDDAQDATTLQQLLRLDEEYDRQYFLLALPWAKRTLKAPLGVVVMIKLLHAMQCAGPSIQICLCQ